LNIFCSLTIYEGVRHFRNIFFALAAFLWLPAAAHCQLEAIPGLEFLHCACDQQSCQEDCKNCACCAVEKCQYRSEQPPLTVPTPDLLPLSPAPEPPEDIAIPVEASRDSITAAPPYLLSSRHFHFRTVLPARAPSLAN
jgi:hypothetical protein